MKSQLYINIILTAIAGLLAVGLFQNAGIIETPKKDVQIVSISQPNRDQNSTMKWDDLPIHGGIHGTVKIETDGFNDAVKVHLDDDFWRRFHRD